MPRYRSHLRGIELEIREAAGVYGPLDDTFLMIEALENRELGKKVLELGTGTGMIAVYCSKRGAEMTATDINEEALRLARENAELNAEKIEFIKSDLFEAVKGRFDAVIFNPPYLPDEEPRDVALDGGKNGYELAERFLMGLPEHLEQDGRCYLLLSSIDAPERLLRTYEHRLIAEKSFFFEGLYVFEIRI